MAVLYLIRKAKSPVKQMWLWRPVAALPQPILPKRDLKVAARATTTMLRFLAEEIPGHFMVHSVNSVNSRFHSLKAMGCSYITELDCKDQFNHVPPQKVLSHFEKSTAGLAKRHRWRMEENTWSVHKDTKRLDTAGRGN